MYAEHSVLNNVSSQCMPVAQNQRKSHPYPPTWGASGKTATLILIKNLW